MTALNRYDEARERALESLNVALRTVDDAPARVIYAMQRVGAIAALDPDNEPAEAQQNRRRAAMLLGYADDRLTAEGAFRWPTDQRDVDRGMVSLIVALGQVEVADLMTRGTGMNDDEPLSSRTTSR